METQSVPLTEADHAAAAERYRPAIQQYILRLVGDPGQAQDLTEEVLLRARRRLADLKDPVALECQLYRIATNVCYDAFRHREHRALFGSLNWTAGRAAQEELLPDEARLEPDQLLEQNAMSDCVGRCLAALPEAERSVLLLHDLQGCSNPEIADRLLCSLPTVKLRLHRARTRLRDLLTNTCESSRDRRGELVCHLKGNSCS